MQRFQIRELKFEAGGGIYLKLQRLCLKTYLKKVYEELKKLLHDSVLGLKLILAMYILYTLPLA
jgi:hypothetical protein